jgi:hypothetical protein
VQGGEDDCLAVVLLHFFIQLVDVPALVEVLVAEQEVTDQQFLDCLHPDASCHLLLTVGHSVLVGLHHVVKLLEHFRLADGLSVLHLLHDSGVT